jgi:Tol biopolymer transport system component
VWLDATHVMSTRTSNGGRTRTTESVDINGGATVLLHADTVSKFFSSVNTTNAAISPDRRWLLYTSDVTGWDQIYVVPTAGGTPVQLTKAPAEHWRAVWSHDSKRIAWDANTAASRARATSDRDDRGHPARRRATLIDPGAARIPRRSGRLTTSAFFQRTDYRIPPISMWPTPSPARRRRA